MTIIDHTATLDEFAQELRTRAMTGELNLANVISSPEDTIRKNVEYQQYCCLGWRPLGIITTLTRDRFPSGRLMWHLSVGFADEERHLPFDPVRAQSMVEAVFGHDASRAVAMGVMSPVGAMKDIHHWMLMV